MQFRHGLCSSCKAEYKIPASFSADRARCKKCGGVVEIGPVQDGDAPSQPAAAAPAAPAAPAVPVAPVKPAPPPVPAMPPAAAKPVVPPPAPVKPPAPPVPPPAPVAKTPPPAPVVPPRPVAPPVPPRAPAPPPQAAKPAPAPAPKLEEVKPSGTQRSGPTMKEKLLARRAAEAAAAEPAPTRGAPAAPRAPGDVGPTGSFGANTAPPVRKAALPRPATPAAAPKAPAVKAAAPAAARAVAPRAGAAKAGASRGAAGKRPARGGSSRGKAGRGKGDDAKKKSPMLLVGSLLGLIVIAGGAYFLLFQDDEPVQAKDGAVQAPIEEKAAGAQDAADATAAEDAAAEETAAPEEATDDAEPELKDEETAEAAAAPAKPAAAEKDPSEIDLAAIPDFGPIEGTSPERWAELQEKAALAADRNSAVHGTRALTALEEAGKESFPAILNEMKKLDYSTEVGYQTGDILQRTLMRIANNQNFGWKYTTEPNDVWFNKKVVELWSTQWERSQDDEGYWLRFTKQEAKADEKQDEAPIDAETEEALDDLDDL